MTPEFTDLRWRLVAEREYAAPTYRSTVGTIHLSTLFKMKEQNTELKPID